VHFDSKGLFVFTWIDPPPSHPSHSPKQTPYSPNFQLAPELLEEEEQAAATITTTPTKAAPTGPLPLLLTPPAASLLKRKAEGKGEKGAAKRPRVQEEAKGCVCMYVHVFIYNQFPSCLPPYTKQNTQNLHSSSSSSPALTPSNMAALTAAAAIGAAPAARANGSYNGLPVDERALLLSQATTLLGNYCQARCLWVCWWIGE
jgi:hypothetical protein